MAEIGPVQLIAIGFGPDAKFEGKIIDELGMLEAQETIRLLDLLFVQKEAETGDLIALDYQGEDLGAIIGALLGFEVERDDGRPNGQPAPESHAFGLSPDDILAMAARLEPGQAAGIMLIEHVWARDLKRAIRGAGGVPLADGFLTPEAIGLVAAELIAMSERLDETGAKQTGNGA